jgi:hypothetical protein
MLHCHFPTNCSKISSWPSPARRFWLSRTTVICEPFFVFPSWRPGSRFARHLTVCTHYANLKTVSLTSWCSISYCRRSMGFDSRRTCCARGDAQLTRVSAHEAWSDGLGARLSSRRKMKRRVTQRYPARQTRRCRRIAMRDCSREFGAGKRARTADLLITNQLLYQLSYAGSA